MRVLIVENNSELGKIWKRHLERHGVDVNLVNDQANAIKAIRNAEINLIVLDLDLPGASVFAIADFASYRRPDARVIFVTNSTFFSDGSIFRHVGNACAMVPSEVPPEDLCAMVEHYGAPAYLM